MFDEEIISFVLEHKTIYRLCDRLQRSENISKKDRSFANKKKF